MTLTEISNRIDAHLKRFEADPIINAFRFTNGVMLPPYYDARAFKGGRYCMVQYLGFHAQSALTKGEAEQYLWWLDDGNVGHHRESLAAGKERDGNHE